MTFERAVALIMDLEGGFTDDPNDSGGATKYGISKSSFPELDIPNLTRDQASAIYKKDYWDRCRCDLLPTSLNLLVFDCAVNQGTDKAIRLLQRSVHAVEDGLIGPETLSKVRELGRGIITEFAAQRMLAYGSIPQFSRYGLGWSRRLMKVVMEALR